MKKKAFTLMELLVVIAIISLLLAILLPSLNKVKELARKIVCGSQLKQTGVGLGVYAQSNDNNLPDLADKAEKYPWRTYAAYWVTADSEVIRPLGLGYLHSAKVIEEPKIFYCPTASLKDWKFEYYDGNDGKRWPSTYANDAQNPVRTTYSYFPQHTSAKEPVDVFTPGVGFSQNYVPKLTYKMARLNQERSVITDRLHVLSAVPHTSGNRKGVNALFGDWHVGFCSNEEAFDEELWHPGGERSGNGPGSDAGIFRTILALLEE
jgi:prepilin-type N-terminal cleavage/methylation domain-containing protein/prepilin-type processing-associated H-X9-DG protein